MPEIVQRLQGPLAAMLRLADSLEYQHPEPLTARVLEQQSSMLEEMADFLEEVLSIVDANNRIFSVILVSEQLPMANALRIALLCAGCRVLAFRSAENALLQARANPRAVDLVITDLELGGPEDGLSLIDALRRLVIQPVPAIVLAPADSPTLRQRSIGREIYGLGKPLDLIAFRRLLATLLEDRFALTAPGSAR